MMGSSIGNMWKIEKLPTTRIQNGHSTEHEDMDQILALFCILQSMHSIPRRLLTLKRVHKTTRSVNQITLHHNKLFLIKTKLTWVSSSTSFSESRSLSLNHVRPSQPSLRSDHPRRLRLHRKVRRQRSLKFLNISSSPLKSLALAGCNPTKLSQTLNWATAPNPPPSIPILTADTTDPPSLRRLCSQNRFILNCVGPFRLYGDPVVAACVVTGCDYLDISGEPEFMERMEASYFDKAAEKGSLVISACGFDSVPAEFGLMFNSRQWVGAAVPNRMEAYLSLESEKRSVGNFGTFESPVLGVANADKLMELRWSRPKKPRPEIPGRTNY